MIIIKKVIDFIGGILDMSLTLNVRLWLLGLCIVALTFLCCSTLGLYIKTRETNIIREVKIQKSVDSLVRIDKLLDSNITNEQILSEDISNVINILLYKEGS